ncbi:MAG: long-chain fatty acid--CoA ligase [Betaproteobacteria bacterium HGW-Betaproteobacteria-10]|nr:MAG: long-chain fatty acid--CoA ligase [Betaproteobacteria bacterium HGW-Betaproteobacteria-10]
MGNEDGALNALSVRAALELQAHLRPGQICFIAPESGLHLSFGELHDDARRLAHFFAGRGLPAGSHVAWLLPNGVQAYRLLIGTMAAGHVAVPLSLLAQAEQLAYVLDHSDSRLVVVAPAWCELLESALQLVASDIAVVVIDPDQADFFTATAAADWSAAVLQTDRPALLMYTSGTTGRPKGVLLTHGNVMAGARFVSLAHRLSAADRVLAVLPLYHINAQIVTALASLLHGGSLVMPRKFSVGDFWPLAAEYRCTWLNVVPTMVAYLLEAPEADAPAGPGIRFCRSASAPLAPEHHRAFEARFGIGIIETMGLTETAAPVFTNPLDAAARKIGSPGQAFGNAARTVDVETGEELVVGISGEIQIRGPNVMVGYYKAPEATVAAFAEGDWLRTGDLGFRDADGFYFITGRIKELIIKGGENIAPREIDEALLCHPDVLEAAAVGVPDHLYGQEILVGVVLKAGSAWDEAALREHCREHLGRFRVPRYFRQLDGLPKGPSGKVQRLKLLALGDGSL